VNGFRIGFDDHVFLPTADLILLRGLAEYDDYPAGFPQLHIQLMFGEANWMTGGYSEKSVFRLLDELSRRYSSVALYAETRGLASYFQRKLGQSVAYYPYPAHPFSDASANEKRGVTKTIGVLGGGRRDKGFGLLPEIVSYIEGRMSGVDFIIQGPRKEECLDDVVGRLRKHGTVRLLSNVLSPKEYEAALRASDMLLLPYLAGYKMRGSGVAVEAIANGIPFVCSAGTAMEELIQDGNGLCADSPMDLATACLELLNRYSLFSVAAQRARSRYLAGLACEHNPVYRNAYRSLC
jgi:glycosyltransferase involved in cell wall biosynthesis